MMLIMKSRIFKKKKIRPIAYSPENLYGTATHVISRTPATARMAFSYPRIVHLQLLL